MLGQLPTIRVLTSELSQEAVYPLGEGLIRIGRSAENNIVLQDTLVSRHHAELQFDGARVTLKDLGGKNPIRVNGAEVQDYKLYHGDRITIGHTELLFEHPGTPPPSPVRVVRDGKGVFEPGLGGISLDAATVFYGKPDLTNVSATEKSYSQLSRLYLISEELLKVTDEDQLFDLVLSTATQETKAERGFIGLAADGETADPHGLAIVRFWDPVKRAEAQTLEMSETILDHIQRNRQAVLVRDIPDRHDFGASVIDLKIRSFICVPMLSPLDPSGEAEEQADRFLGLIYVDTRGSREQFDRSDLEFVSAIGRMGGPTLENLRIRRKLQSENEKLRSLMGVGGELIGSSEPMKRVFQLIEKVAPRDASVLITGENGTGKELVARAIHQRSSRKDRPFVAVNCGAIPATLVESELFGYEKGAFTGANQDTVGKFELAHSGTLFLDEIGDMPLDMQVKIVRALQERKFYRVGGKKEISVDIRVIAATNRDLGRAIEKGSFREDLYFRLAVVAIEVPPLRSRGEDILEIAERFLGQGSSPIVVTPAARECLINYHWPGNIRELRNVLEQAAILGDGKKITPADLPSHIAKGGRGKMVFRLKPLAEIEKQYILRVLEETEGNKARTASILGISRETLYQKLKLYEESPTG
ncbi:MAG TPA: sigma 54-interacting transcriptional regulator [Planctomycetota bacterium]|nr:sigma 54-interacting transcriptional regulator [Planctomycetota bacterium]